MPDPSMDGAVQDDVTADELLYEQAVAFGVEGYDADDPWNAVLCLEGSTTATVLPLTPTHLDYLVQHLGEVRDAQRIALGASAEQVDDSVDEKPRALQRVAHMARMATGSEGVSRAWAGSVRGRITIIAVTLILVSLGVILSVLT